MRVAIFSDIHGNVYAFEKVLEAMKKDSPDKYIFCGDICGYYYYQNEIIDMLKSLKNLVCVKGNHDQIFLDILSDPSINDEYQDKYGVANLLLTTNIKKENVKFLKELPDYFICNDLSLAVFHGSPWDYLNEYVYPDTPLDRFNRLTHSFVLLGHTHYPMDRHFNDTHIINPGSCGQPRNSTKPSYAVLDTDCNRVTFRSVLYDNEKMIKDVIMHNEKNHYLVDVLKREDTSYAQ